MKDVEKEKLTAYALGELSFTERAEIEEIVSQSPELQKEIVEIQKLGRLLSQKLQSEELPKIADENRSQFLEKALPKKSQKPFWKSILQGRIFPIGIVMTAFLGIVVFFSIQQEMLNQKDSNLSNEMQGMNTSLALKDKANKPQLIAPEPDQYAANGALKESKVKKGVRSQSLTAVAGKGLGAKFRDDGVTSEESFLEAAPISPDRKAKVAKPRKDFIASNDSFPMAMRKKVSDTSGVTSVKLGGAVAPFKKKSLQVQSNRKLKRSGLFSAFGGDAGGSVESPHDNLGGPRGHSFPLGGNSYEAFTENPFKAVSTNPLSTFSVDVDTASYTNLRRSINESNTLPPVASVRIEEMINYFDYSDATPKGKDPFSVTTEVAESPWSDGHKLVRIGIKGKVFPKKNHKTNLVFLVDVSGSMDSHDKIGLLKEGLHKLIEELGEDDHVSLVTYAGHSAVVLDSTSADKKKSIHQAVDQLTAGGSTHGSEGINTAYEIAQKHFRKEGVNRVILATDGDFNVGTTSDQALVNLVKEKAKAGVFLTVLGFGSGNLNDSMMEKISNKGNGNYFYIDSEKEAKKVLVDKLQGTLVTIAKDVKIQVEFNPSNVSEYRLIGYENRQLDAKDFNDDKKDAGEIGAGHTVVALYEIKPKGFAAKGVDALKYQPTVDSKKKESVKGKWNKELLTVKLRYKDPQGTKSKLISIPVQKAARSFASASVDLRWTASVAGFGMLLKKSNHKGSLTYSQLIKITEKARWGGEKYDSYRSEFLELVKKAKKLSGHH